MATLIAVYNSDGCIGRCDAKCYEAVHPHCDCICGGKNHGAGEKQAISNTQQMAESWIDAYKQQYSKDHPNADLKFDVTQEVTQLKLF